jgi:CDP-paratose 2-epimerase
MTEPVIGILEWLRPGEHERVERVLADLRTLGITELRTGVSWADSYTPEGEKWYDWLLPRLAREIDVLPCFMYTPPSLGVVPKSSSPPRDPKAYADFIDVMITRYGEYFDWIEFWNEPNNLSEWDWTLDPEWRIFCEMVGGAAHWAKQRGKKTVLGGVLPIDPYWVRLMCECGVVQYMDVVGVHAFPGTFETGWIGWTATITKVREVLDRYGSIAEIWITETGYSTWRHDERRQVSAFLDSIKAPAERVYWYASYDLESVVPTHDGLYSDMREYYFGLKHTDGTPKLLFNLWANGGLEAVRNAAWLCEPVNFSSREERPVLITGGAGFVGTNLAHRLLESGQSVLIFDNLSRPGVDKNLRWLRETHSARVQIEVADIRDGYALLRAVQSAGQIFHFAAQVAVTTSLTKPVYDFEINARGTLNLLEALRTLKDPPPLVFTSTNKVYGALKDILLTENATRYEPEDLIIGANGISEDHTIDFLSPYGCSKGMAEQYIIEYARTFAIPAVVFRMSCIYGPHQFGTTDQGWMAHFLIHAIEGKPIKLYGDGKQVRDVLFVDDLVNAFLLAQENMKALAGQVFNIGGGPANTISLLEFISLISEMHDQKPSVYFGKWRLGDQRYYVSDTKKFQAATGWSPEVSVDEGVKRLYQWLLEHHGVASGRPAVERGCDERSTPPLCEAATGTRTRRRAALTGTERLIIAAKKNRSHDYACCSHHQATDDPA